MSTNGLYQDFLNWKWHHVHRPLRRLSAMGRGRERIEACCPGFPDKRHWDFYHEFFERFDHVRNVAVLGVFKGRDIAYMSHALWTLHENDFRIVGCDIFPASNGLSRDAALFNIAEAGWGRNIEIVEGDISQLDSRVGQFDFVYIDIAHDYESTIRSIDLAHKLLRQDGLVGGDDFADVAGEKHATTEEIWGVASAVDDRFAWFDLYENWIWWAPITALRRGRGAAKA